MMAEKPTGTTAEAISQTAIQVSWVDSVDGVQYLVYVSETDFAAATLVGAAAAGIQQYAARGLTPGTNYLFFVVAIAADGLQSDPDGPAEATTSPLFARPENFYVEVRGSRSLWLTWDDVEGAELYLIYIGETDDFSAADLVQSVSQGTEVAALDGLIPEHEYFVWVVARAGESTGEPSVPVQVTTLAAAGGALDIPSLKNGVYSWAVGVLEAAEELTTSVIWANQNGARPQGKHIQLGLAGPMISGASDSISPTAEAGQVFEQKGLRSFLVSVNLYAPASEDALGLISRLQSSLSNPVLRLPLESAGIGVSRVADARDLSAFLETRWETRIQFDFVIFATLRDEVVQDLIETALIKNITPQQEGS